MTILCDNKIRPRVIKLICNYCKAEFVRSSATKPRLNSQILNKKKHYCCLSCAYAGRTPKTNKTILCNWCSIEFHRQPSAVRETNFCSKQCFVLFQRTIPRKKRPRKPLSEQHKEKISKANRGRKRTDNLKQLMSAKFKGKNNPMSGRKHTDETKNKISKANKGRKRKQCSVETKEKMSIAQKGKKTSLETREKISANHADVSGTNNPMFGKQHSVLTRNKIASAIKGKLRTGKEHHWFKEPGDRLTELYMQIRTCTKYKIWRRTVYQRDAFTCAWCNTNTRKNNTTYLNADHIKPFATIIKENKIKTLEQAYACQELWDTNNGRTLCVECHKKTDSFGRRIKPK